MRLLWVSGAYIDEQGDEANDTTEELTSDDDILSMFADEALEKVEGLLILMLDGLMDGEGDCVMDVVE